MRSPVFFSGPGRSSARPNGRDPTGGPAATGYTKANPRPPMHSAFSLCGPQRRVQAERRPDRPSDYPAAQQARRSVITLRDGHQYRNARPSRRSAQRDGQVVWLVISRRSGDCGVWYRSSHGLQPGCGLLAELAAAGPGSPARAGTKASSTCRTGTCLLVQARSQHDFATSARRSGLDAARRHLFTAAFR